MRFCFHMKNAVIQCAIGELQRNGLRFSIDEVARTLKISKKTIYKYFATKEQLAVEIYKTFYEDARHKLEIVSGKQSEDAVRQMLEIYYQSHCMTGDEIFNKYALNGQIRSLAQTNHNRIGTLIENLFAPEDRAACMIIVDGALHQLCENKGEEEKVISRLVTILC